VLGKFSAGKEQLSLLPGELNPSICQFSNKEGSRGVDAWLREKAVDPVDPNLKSVLQTVRRGFKDKKRAIDAFYGMWGMKEKKKGCKPFENSEANKQAKLRKWNVILNRLLSHDSKAGELLIEGCRNSGVKERTPKDLQVHEILVAAHRLLFQRSSYDLLLSGVFVNAGKKRGVMVLASLFVEFVSSKKDLENLLHILRGITDLQSEIQSQYLFDESMTMIVESNGPSPFSASPFDERDLGYLVRLFSDPVSALTLFFISYIQRKGVEHMNQKEAERVKALDQRTGGPAKKRRVKKWMATDIPAKRITAVVSAAVNSAWLKIIRLLGPVVRPTDYGNRVSPSKSNNQKIGVQIVRRFLLLTLPQYLCSPSANRSVIKRFRKSPRKAMSLWNGRSATLWF
jgi:hypothetical protein